MPNYTLTYSPPAEGWPSFYSYEPEWIQGMNQYLYTFSGGNLFRHNTNEVRNNFYGIQGNSTITSVFNDEPIVNKIFKTMQLEGNRPWAAVMNSDQQDGRFMDVGFFERKEGDWFAFVRTETNTPAQPDEYALRTLNGIGVGTVTAPGQVDFPTTVNIGSILSVNDYFYYAAPLGYDTLVYAGVVTAINVDLPAGINQVLHNNAGVPDPALVAPLCVGIKNQVAESNGLLGHYGVFTLTNEDTTAVELFVARSEVMKSYPG
jgi:hypothetical protein